MPSPWPGAFFLTDPTRTPDPVSVVKSLPVGCGVIYRHFGAAHRFETAMNLRAACFQKGIPLVIANDPRLAIRVRADGVHWPEANAYKARRWQERFLLQTQSAHSASGIRDAICDAVLFSTVFPSNSPSARNALGATRFRALARKANRLVYALGGVGGDTAGSVSNHTGLAAIEGFLSTVV